MNNDIMPYFNKKIHVYDCNVVGLSGYMGHLGLVLITINGVTHLNTSSIEPD